MNDYSEVMSHIRQDIYDLEQSLLDKKYPIAKTIAKNIESDMNDLIEWILTKEK